MHFKFVRKHSQYFRMHWLFLHAHLKGNRRSQVSQLETEEQNLEEHLPNTYPAPMIFTLLFCLKASGLLSRVISIALNLSTEPSSFKQPTHVQIPGMHAFRCWKHVQYSLRHLERIQLHACSPDGSLLGTEALPALVKALGFRARIDWIACGRGRYAVVSYYFSASEKPTAS